MDRSIFADRARRKRAEESNRGLLSGSVEITPSRAKTALPSHLFLAEDSVFFSFLAQAKLVQSTSSASTGAIKFKMELIKGLFNRI